MTMLPIPLVLAAAMALAPLGAGQQVRLAAWLAWAAAYRDCYAPAPFSLRIDQRFTARCIERALQPQARHGPPEQRAATDALIAATPGLVAMLNAPVDQAGKGVTPDLNAAPPPRSPPPSRSRSTASRR